MLGRYQLIKLDYLKKVKLFKILASPVLSIEYWVLSIEYWDNLASFHTSTSDNWKWNQEQRLFSANWNFLLLSYFWPHTSDTWQQTTDNWQLTTNFEYWDNLASFQTSTSDNWKWNQEPRAKNKDCVVLIENFFFFHTSDLR